jgi:hypothetical protein
MYSERQKWSCFPILGSGRSGYRLRYEHSDQDDSPDWIVRSLSLSRNMADNQLRHLGLDVRGGSTHVLPRQLYSERYPGRCHCCRDRS